MLGIKQNLTVEEDLEFWSEFYQNKHDNEILNRLGLHSKKHSQCRIFIARSKTKISTYKIVLC